MSLSAWFRDVASGQRKGMVAQVSRRVLATAEPLYRAVIHRKNWRFDAGSQTATRVAAPVISVGNLTVGGTGKTPLVCWLAEWFRSRGAAVTLISRGYGAKHGQPNDEALELAARLPEVPHLQNPNRVAAAEAALQANPRQVLILDDAFQHRRMARDLDIVLLDALAPFGYGHLLPRGLLREPVEGLARAQVVALSRADAIEPAARDAIRRQVAGLASRAIWLELVHRPVGLVNSIGTRQPLASLAGNRIAAFCGIGNPAGFRHTLSQCGLEVAGFREFADHFAYTEGDLAQLARWSASLVPIAALICTRKDLVKIPRESLGGIPLWAIDIDLAIESGQEQLEPLLAAIRSRVASGN
ncbi:MAG: tetraacyldisaccharide 4'-kinase [Pirellulaceae bacterium]|nr:tetraacyldisaccharide 4'-kinase [Pirellulaceae bacterium]